MSTKHPEIIVIGGAVADISLVPVGPEVFNVGSTPLDSIAMRVGGDAANEAITLARLGRVPALITRLGRDVAGDFIFRKLDEAGVDTRFVAQEKDLDTSINILLVDTTGERHFLTNRNGSLRKLRLQDILPALDSPALSEAKVACLASMFVSPPLTLEDTARLYDVLREKGLILCADTTRRKRGETLREAGDALSRLDYFFPNMEEAVLLTGERRPDAIADALLGAGVRHVCLKLGSRGCLLASKEERYIVPAYPDALCLDTTGAGDTFAAAFITALLEGRPFRDCGRWANAAASLCIEQVGATGGSWTREDVERRVEEIGIRD